MHRVPTLRAKVPLDHFSGFVACGYLFKEGIVNSRYALLQHACFNGTACPLATVDDV